MSAGAPNVSVIVPMYNAEKVIERCLAPLLAILGDGEIVEIIVVDDGSTDRSAAIVRPHASVQLLAMDVQGGPGAARNRAAQTARGEYLWFVDSDVVVAEDAARVLRETLARARPAAVIGLYDDCPDATNFLSQYKNLVHHYYHHRAKDQLSTFWAGCGAVQRSLFLRLGGFDARRYRYPSIEDIELGYRIADAGGVIVLERRLHAKHLKQWRLFNLLHTEVFRRAWPWSRLMLERKDFSDDLNVSKSERVRAALTCAVLLTMFTCAIGWTSASVLVLLTVVLVVANASFIAFFARTRGLLFAFRAFLFHQLYYLYATVSFAVALTAHCLGRRHKSGVTG